MNLHTLLVVSIITIVCFAHIVVAATTTQAAYATTAGVTATGAGTTTGYGTTGPQCVTRTYGAPWYAPFHAGSQRTALCTYTPSALPHTTCGTNGCLCYQNQYCADGLTPYINYDYLWNFQAFCACYPPGTTNPQRKRGLGATTTATETTTAYAYTAGGTTAAETSQAPGVTTEQPGPTTTNGATTTNNGATTTAGPTTKYVTTSFVPSETHQCNVPEPCYCGYLGCECLNGECLSDGLECLDGFCVVKQSCTAYQEPWEKECYCGSALCDCAVDPNTQQDLCVSGYTPTVDNGTCTCQPERRKRDYRRKRGVGGATTTAAAETTAGPQGTTAAPAPSTTGETTVAPGPGTTGGHGGATTTGFPVTTTPVDPFSMKCRVAPPCTCGTNGCEGSLRAPACSEGVLWMGYCNELPYTDTTHSGETSAAAGETSLPTADTSAAAGVTSGPSGASSAAGHTSLTVGGPSTSNAGGASTLAGTSTTVGGPSSSNAGGASTLAGTSTAAQSTSDAGEVTTAEIVDGVETLTCSVSLVAVMILCTLFVL